MYERSKFPLQHYTAAHSRLLKTHVWGYFGRFKHLFNTRVHLFFSSCSSSKINEDPKTRCFSTCFPAELHNLWRLFWPVGNIQLFPWYSLRRKWTVINLNTYHLTFGVVAGTFSFREVKRSRTELIINGWIVRNGAEWKPPVMGNPFELDLCISSSRVIFLSRLSFSAALFGLMLWGFTNICTAPTPIDQCHLWNGPVTLNDTAVNLQC